MDRKEYWRNWERKNRVKRNLQARRVDLVCEFCDRKYKGFRKTQRFCSRKCMGLTWMNKITPRYKKLYLPKHENASSDGRIRNNRFVMSKHLGRPLLREEVVHHIDGNVKNDSIDNLMLFPSASAHHKFHWKLRKNEK